MVSSAIFHFSSSLLHFPSSYNTTRSAFPRHLLIKASASLNYSTATSLKTNNWQWKFKDNSINIYYEEHEKESTEPTKNILMIPTISDVSTVEEWRLVAKDIVQQVGKVNWRATIIDWPGLGYSDRPKLDFNADVMEKFLVDFINSPNSPISSSVVVTGVKDEKFAELFLVESAVLFLCFPEFQRSDRPEFFTASSLLQYLNSERWRLDLEVQKASY